MNNLCTYAQVEKKRIKNIYISTYQIIPIKIIYFQQKKKKNQEYKQKRILYLIAKLSK